jgi:hypothetical protein
MPGPRRLPSRCAAVSFELDRFSVDGGDYGDPSAIGRAQSSVVLSAISTMFLPAWQRMMRPCPGEAGNDPTNDDTPGRTPWFRD